ncbi:MAG: archease, partial [Fidelibacterota bacterium]
YNFLEEFLVLFDCSDFLLARVVDVKLDNQQMQLDAKAVGDHLGNYELHLGIKAVTYSDMFVRTINNSWIAQVVLDV